MFVAIEMNGLAIAVAGVNHGSREIVLAHVDSRILYHTSRGHRVETDYEIDGGRVVRLYREEPEEPRHDDEITIIVRPSNPA